MGEGLVESHGPPVGGRGQWEEWVSGGQGVPERTSVPPITPPVLLELGLCKYKAEGA